jgi:sugar lactone lactonase YvrE
MDTHQLDKETYRDIIDTYFRAFETKDFSPVRFSSAIEFLSPISGNTFKGRDEVVRFLSSVVTRVTAVNILAIVVDYPQAAGVWQMTTTKGIQYTLHNYFRLDGEGLSYIWPMFDPKAIISIDAPEGKALMQWLRGTGYYETAAHVPQQPAGLTVSETGRLFVTMPRWLDKPDPSVAEVLPDGSLLAYPNVEMNQWDQQPGDSASNHFVCAQSVHAEGNNLWILDPAAPMFGDVVDAGPKLVQVDLQTDTVSRTFQFDASAAPVKSYLNDVRIADGHAFITDSGLGAIIVMNLATGHTRRLLEEHPSTKAEPGIHPVIEGNRWELADGTTPQVNSDGIAIDPSQEYLYYKALTGKTLYRVSISSLLDTTLSSSALAGKVEEVAKPGLTDGLEFDSDGNLYLSGIETNSILMLTKEGELKMIASAGDFLWPDSLTVSQQGDLLFTAGQFHRMPAFNSNVDKRTPPYSIFRLRLPHLNRR